jgi:hypothetical protein
MVLEREGITHRQSILPGGAKDASAQSTRYANLPLLVLFATRHFFG